MQGLGQTPQSLQQPGKSLVYRECQLSCWAQHALPFVSQLEAAATHSIGSVARWAVFCNSPVLPCSGEKQNKNFSMSSKKQKKLRCSQSGPAASDEMASSTAIRSATEGGCLLRKGRVQTSTHTKLLKLPNLWQQSEVRLRQAETSCCSNRAEQWHTSFAASHGHHCMRRKGQQRNVSIKGKQLNACAIRLRHHVVQHS